MDNTFTVPSTAPSGDVVRQGRRLLRDLLPACRAEAQRGGGLATGSPLGEALAGRLTEADVEAVLVYRTARGWYGDVAFKGGLSIGTPVDEPLATRAEAEAAARSTLVAFLGGVYTRGRTN